MNAGVGKQIVRTQVHSTVWVRRTLLGAAVTDALLGLSLLVFPYWFAPGAPDTDFAVMATRSIGVGLLGLGLALAFALLDHVRFWPLVVVGLLGNLPGGAAIAFAVQHSADANVLPLWPVGLRVLWCIPLALVLRDIWTQTRRAGREIRDLSPDYLRGYFEMAVTQRGDSIAELSEQRPVLLVMLRQSGCTFCREALSDLREQRRAIEAAGAHIVLVHLSSESDFVGMCERYGVDDLDRIEDTEAELYRALGLGRGSFGAVFGPFVWLRGLLAGMVGGHGIGALTGDPLRMPGVFLVRQSRVVGTFRHRSVAERPNYVRLVTARA